MKITSDCESLEKLNLDPLSFVALPLSLLYVYFRLLYLVFYVLYISFGNSTPTNSLALLNKAQLS